MTTQPTTPPDGPTSLALVVPCYNEQEVLADSVAELLKQLLQMRQEGLIGEGSRLWLVDDGSTDATWRLIQQHCAEHDAVCGVKLSRNRGHQAALLAGLEAAGGTPDAVVTIDADLQDDPGAIVEMVRRHRRGADIVLGVRGKRDTDSFFKRTTAEGFYWLMRRLGVKVVHNHADYRLMSRRALRALSEYPERNLFLRGIVPELGFRPEQVVYDRRARQAGVSKYPLVKMIALAWQAVTSFSVAPLRLIMLTGLVVFLGSIGVAAWILYVRLFTDASVPGWASTTLPIVTLGGLQLFATGVVGEYLGKVYLETKRRPHYFIEEVIS